MLFLRRGQTTRKSRNSSLSTLMVTDSDSRPFPSPRSIYFTVPCECWVRSSTDAAPRSIMLRGICWPIGIFVTCLLCVQTLCQLQEHVGGPSRRGRYLPACRCAPTGTRARRTRWPVAVQRECFEEHRGLGQDAVEQLRRQRVVRALHECAYHLVPQPEVSHTASAIRGGCCSAASRRR